MAIYGFHVRGGDRSPVAAEPCTRAETSWPYTGQLPELIGIPGGGVQKGENAVQAAFREVRRKPGFSCPNASICHIGCWLDGTRRGDRPSASPCSCRPMHSRLGNQPSVSPSIPSSG